MINNSYLRFFGIFILFTAFLFSEAVVLTLDGGNLNYESTADIAGFQFNHNGCVTAASGGDAAANGFTISSSGSTVLAFSFTGSVIPAGEGTLVELAGDISYDCLDDFIFSDSDGGALSVDWPGGGDDADWVVNVGGGSNTFDPSHLDIEVGETVQWVNMGGNHNVDGSTDTYPNNPDSFSSGSVSNDDWSYSFTFTVEGDYEYECNPHAGMGMLGSISVSSGVDGGDNVLSIIGSDVNAGGSTTIDIALENPNDIIAGFEFYLTDFPNTYGSFISAETTERTQQFSISANEQADGTYIIVGFDLTQTGIQIGEGPIVTVGYQSDEIYTAEIEINIGDQSIIADVDADALDYSATSGIVNVSEY